MNIKTPLTDYVNFVNIYIRTKYYESKELIEDLKNLSKIHINIQINLGNINM